jgi:tetratricopeptide (TPR) repeat protein
MMVKNDVAVMWPCFNSLGGIVDCVVICDVGCTDATLRIVNDFIRVNRLPGVVHQHPWQSFEHNRTLSVLAAQEFIKKIGFSPSETYLLILDADTTLSIDPAFTKKSLYADAYLLLENSPAFCNSTYSMRLLRANLPWRSTGIYYEDWVLSEDLLSEKLRTLRVNEDPKRTRNKLEEGVELLRAVLESHPDNVRCIFHLAQAYQGLQEFDEAIHWYEERIGKEGNEEEIWFSTYMIGICYEKMDQWQHALDWYLRAYQANRKRGEPLMAISRHFRLSQQNDLAYLFAKHGASIPFPDNSTICSIPALSNYQFEEELSKISRYTPFKEEGLAASDALLLRRGVPESVRSEVHRNLQHYVQNLPNTYFFPIVIEVPLIREGSSERYHPLNPSIQRTDHGYDMISGAVNYTQKDGQIFSTVEADGIFRSRNFLLQYDRNFNLLSQREIIEDLPRQQIRSLNLEGLYDCRLFGWNGSYWFTCTTGDVSPYGKSQLALCKLGGDKVEHLTPLVGPESHRPEKNWLPFVKEDVFYAMGSFDPFVLYQLNRETGICRQVRHYHPDHNFSNFRGSAGPIPFDDGYLVLIHEIMTLDGYEKGYLHRFIYLERNFCIQKASKPFVFRHIGVEFCCGMTLDHSETELMLALGIEDRETWICMVDLETVRSLLQPLPVYLKELSPTLSELK